MFHFMKSKGLCIELTEVQKGMLSSSYQISKVLHNENVLAFDIYHDSQLIGFALLRKYDDTTISGNSYFLWDYAIDCNYQNQGYGTSALKELLRFLNTTYAVKKVTTTYLCGNEHAKHIYEKIGFIETDIVHEGNVHEVNMMIMI